MDLKEKPASGSISTSRSRRALRHRPHSCEDSESEDDDVRDREPSRIERGNGLKTISKKIPITSHERDFPFFGSLKCHTQLTWLLLPTF